MKLKFFIVNTMLLFCTGYTVANESVQTRPMTRYEKAIADITDPKELKIAYDTLKTDYDRRYFLNALPGYFEDHHITTVPVWVEKAVLDGIKSKDAKYIREAVLAGGALKINFSDIIMELYPIIDTKFGYHADMLKSTVLMALCKMDNGNKKKFYSEILADDKVSMMSATFEALLAAIYSEPDPEYVQRLNNLSSRVDGWITETNTGTDKEKTYRLTKLQDIKDRIKKVRDRISQGGGK